MGFGTSTIKYILFFINFVFALCGLALAGFGLLTKYIVSKSDELADKVSGDTAALIALAMIIIGGAVFIVSFFGCCGAIRESHCMITIYAMFLLAIFLIQVSLGVYAYLHQEQIEVYTRKGLTSYFDNYNKSNSTQTIVDQLQHELHCCGVDNIDYWTAEKNPGGLPHSCCREDQGYGTVCTKTEAWQEGCLPIASQKLKKESWSFIKVVLAIAGGELIGIIFALCLASSIRNEERRQGYA
ncbi:CD63 antigen-like [Daktulosphaira vitifoliae]|uniref:CD63 antigen-like n=1 Tax=Daktulosphaira vitifoliae TaxID=58002 RepID=UPI0021AA4C05|nr:CD63 antigen-like [Daktulosphaira vitifoliae]